MTRSTLLTVLLVLTSQLSWGAPATIDEIIGLLATDEKSPGGPGVQEAGAKIVQLSDSQREELIVAGLKSSNRAVRYQVAEMVNSREAALHLGLLVNLAENDEDASIRDSAFLRVNSIDKGRALVLSRKLKDDPDARVRFLALTSLLFSSEPEDQRAVESALRADHLLVRIGLTKVQAINGKPFDIKIAREGVGVDVEWFKKYPLNPAGYLWRLNQSDAAARYYVRTIRQDAVDILRMVGTPEDIPFLERAGEKEAAAKDKDLAFEVNAFGTAEIIRLRSMPESERLEYLKPKVRDPRIWMREWAVRNLCGVPGGAEFLKSIAMDASHPAHMPARSYDKRCTRYGTAH